jgi:alcohol dehydrogenase class IV
MNETTLAAFNYQHGSEIIFGNGRIQEIGTVLSRYGRRCLIVSGPKQGALRDLYPVVGDLVGGAGLQWEHFDGVAPNPTVDLVSEGAKVAKHFRADVILGIGGGSSLDAAKAIAVEATHEGTSWDYLFFKRKPSGATLPVVAVGTTSGSQVTQVAVVTNPNARDKSALYDDQLIPRTALVDPQLTLSVPPAITNVCNPGERTVRARETIDGAPGLHQQSEGANCRRSAGRSCAFTLGRFDPSSTPNTDRRGEVQPFGTLFQPLTL